MRNTLSLLLLFLMSCISLKPHQKVKQGICGTILLQQGNQMPGPGRKLSAGQPVVREVAVYQITNSSNVKSNNSIFTGIKTALIAKTTSNEKGYYELALPTGQYSVFVIEKEGLFASISDGKGNINPVQVLADSLTQKNIQINNKAAF